MSKTIASLVTAATLTLGLVAAAAPPANDACSAATTVPALELPFDATVDTTQATSDGDPAVSCVTPAPGHSVWYTFRPETTDVYAFDTGGTEPFAYEPVLALYTGTCGGLNPVAGACARRRLAAELTAGTTYYLLVAGAGVIVDPGIRISSNGVDLCPSGPSPGGGGCGTNFTVRVGDQLAARAYNQLDDTLLTTGTFAWSFGTNADPASATGPSSPFKYTAPVESTNVVLTWTPPGQAAITRQATMNVVAASGSGAARPAGPGPLPLAAAETATIPSPGGLLSLRVQRDAPEWRNTAVVPSVASIQNAFGIPYVSDLSLTNLASIETVVGLQLWTAAGKRESSLIRLPAGGSHTVPDVVKTAFGLQQTFGALVLFSDGPIAAGARTWAPVATGGTNGQFTLAGDVSNPYSASVLRTGESAVFAGVRQGGGFRTNIGVFNLSAKECVVEMEALDDSGHRAGTKAVLTVPATRYVQETLETYVTSLASGSVVITNATQGCSVGGVAYVIDNATQDPFSVPLRKRP